MDFVTAVKTCLQKYADFNGRARRSEFWWFMLFSLAVQLLGQMIGGDVLQSLIALGLLLPSLAVAVRRIHDTGRTGWWALLLLVPALGFLILLFFFYIRRGDPGSNRFGRDPIREEETGTPPGPRDRAAPTEFDDVMNESYQKSRIPRTGDDD